MRCPSLSELPPPPPGKSGWPWTIESQQVPDTMPDGRAWPRISIVTPSYNQGEYIEETIRSILLQGYPDLEYIIIDGASTDVSIEIINKYSEWITLFVSEKDNGQADAINKGVDKITGHIFNWINSDDFMDISALKEVAYHYAPDIIAAFTIREFSPGWEHIVSNENLELEAVLKYPDQYVFRQPGVWFPNTLISTCFPLSIDFHYAFDWEMLIKLRNTGAKVLYSDAVVSNFRHHPKSKTISSPEKWSEEYILILRRLLENPDFQGLYPLIEKKLRIHEWYYMLSKEQADINLRRFIRLITLAFAHPAERLNKSLIKELLGKKLYAFLKKYI